MLILHPHDLIPSTAKRVEPFQTRFGETWFAVTIERDGCRDSLSVWPTEAEARAEIGRSADLRGGAR